MKLVTVDPEVTRVKKRKVVTVLRDQDDGSLTVLVGGAHLPMEDFLENHLPLQVGGFSQDGPRLVALMIAEEIEPERPASLGF